MGQVLMPPYYWHKIGEDSTLDPRQSGVVEEISHKRLATTSTQTHQQQDSSTLDSRRSELIEERVSQPPKTSRQSIRGNQRLTDSEHRGLFQNKTHADINELMVSNQDQRSVLISDEETTQRIDPIDDNFYKRKSVFERLGVAPTSLLNTNKDALKDNRQDRIRGEQSDIKRPKVDSDIVQRESYDDNHSNNRPSQTQHKNAQQEKNTRSGYPEHDNNKDTLYKNNRGYAHAKDKHQYDNHTQNKSNNKPRESERYGSDGKGENAHNRVTSRESHHSRRSQQEEQVQ